MLLTHNFGELGVTVRACQTMLVPIPLVFALMAEDHLAICLRGTHGGQIAATTRGLVAIRNERARLANGAARRHFAGQRQLRVRAQKDSGGQSESQVKYRWAKARG